MEFKKGQLVGYRSNSLMNQMRLNKKRTNEQKENLEVMDFQFELKNPMIGDETIEV